MAPTHNIYSHFILKLGTLTNRLRKHWLARRPGGPGDTAMATMVPSAAAPQLPTCPESNASCPRPGGSALKPRGGWEGRGGGEHTVIPLSLGVILIQTPENILEQMDSFHNHQAKGWAERTLRYVEQGTGMEADSESGMRSQPSRKAEGAAVAAAAGRLGGTGGTALGLERGQWGVSGEQSNTMLPGREGEGNKMWALMKKWW